MRVNSLACCLLMDIPLVKNQRRVNPLKLPIINPIPSLCRIKITAPVLESSAVIHSKTIAVRITLAASFKTLSNSEILPTLWQTLMFLIIGPTTLGPVAVTRAPKRAEIWRGIPMRKFVSKVIPKKVISTPMLLNQSTL